MPYRHPAIILVVVCSIALAALTYIFTLAFCAVQGITPPESLLSNMKDFGLVALGSLVTLLARTSSGSESTEPVSAKIVNKPDEAIPTDPQ